MAPSRWFTRALTVIGPGLLVAATGVGAGDLATGAFAGSHLGTAVLWAVVVGAALKFTVNEGLARWQLATESTLLEGVGQHFGRWAIALFLPYLLLWSFFVASALMGACGAAMHALLPWQDARTDKIVYGIGHSLAAVALIRLGGFRLFEGVMSACLAAMFAVVVASAVAIGPDWHSILSGLLIPRIPHADGKGLSWTIALMGGIGGTVTVLSYGYWIRVEGRRGGEKAGEIAEIEAVEDEIEGDGTGQVENPALRSEGEGNRGRERQRGPLAAGELPTGQARGRPVPSARTLQADLAGAPFPVQRPGGRHGRRIADR